MDAPVTGSPGEPALSAESLEALAAVRARLRTLPPCCKAAYELGRCDALERVLAQFDTLKGKRDIDGHKPLSSETMQAPLTQEV